MDIAFLMILLRDLDIFFAIIRFVILIGLNTLVASTHC